MIEAGVVLNNEGGPMYWHLPNGRSGGILPDSRDIWDILTENKDNVSGFAHSHAGTGAPSPSYIDLTTFSAIENGLDKRLDWWIITGDSIILSRWTGPGKLHYTNLDVNQQPTWVSKLREHSNYIGEQNEQQ